MKISTTVTTEIDLDVQTAAEWFSGLDDDQQTQFFVAVAEIAKSWPGSADTQWYSIGGHLRSCDCSTDDAREMIRSIARYMETSNHV